MLGKEQSSCKRRIVYIHIPKSAGTSQRFLFEKKYGADRVFWWPRKGDNDTLPRIPIESERWPIVGGHIRLESHNPSINSLYLSIVRDPIPRVLSLFNYFTKPYLAEEGFFRIEREKQREEWIERGIDCDSLVNSLNTCLPFRDLAENSQCKHLSRGKKTFEGVLKTLQEQSYIIGDFSDISKFHDAICKELVIGEDAMIHVNKSKSNSVAHTDIETIEAIETLCKEDLKLYHWVSKDCDGLASSL